MEQHGKSDKELAAEIVITYLQKPEVKMHDAEPDKIADYFDIIYQKIRNV